MKGGTDRQSLAGRVRAPANASRRKPDPEAASLGDAHGRAFTALLAHLSRHAPFLWRLARAEPERLRALAETDPDAFREMLIADQSAVAERVRSGAMPRGEAGRALRRNRSAFALLAGLADLGAAWSLDDVLDALTRFADASVRSATAIALADAAAAGTLAADRIGPDGEGSGLAVFALGKHGAGELNYSSDIDLVVFFDPAAPALAPGAEPSRVFNRVAQTIVKLLSERTADGYVHRVDYRLRPDPGSTPAAVSLPAAYGYYETLGQNWERAAWIKARPVAGDVGLGERFLEDLRPFTWRKYFDFAAIADIHAMKRQIHAVRGFGEIAVAGHDIKLGRGGIREIEFFVQTQQLVFGGRRAALRGRRTLDMLAALAADGWIEERARDELSESYRFLRNVEHRLQMRADEQTQRLPAEAEELEGFAAFCGYRDADAFSQALTAHAGRVQRHYALLFENAPELAVASGNLVFTGASDDPDTLATLRQLGFRQPETAAETVRGWHFGRRAAVTSPRAREVLTELVPGLLQALGGTADPDGALARLDRAFARMPAAVELMTILRSNERLRQLFADLLGTAPRLAEIVSGRPHVLDALIDPGFALPSAKGSVAEGEFRALLGQPVGTEEFLDRVRDAAGQLNFLTGARLLSGILSPVEAGRAFAAVAEAAIRACLERVESAFAAEHGTVPGGRVAVLGLGRLGVQDLTATSDLDLVVIYDFRENSRTSDGRRPLDAVVYYTRLTQRLLAALTAPTSRGRLYDVDMRLRPSGTKGPLATQLSGFVAYQAGEAELWEHMALTRARPLAGEAALREELGRLLHGIVTRPRDAAAVAREVAAMRDLIATEKGADEHDPKLAPGGLTDLDFLAQALVLAHAHAHPRFAGLATDAVFGTAAREGLLDEALAAQLTEAYRLQDDLLHWQRLSAGTRRVPEEEGEWEAAATAARLAVLAGFPDAGTLAARLAELREPVRAAFGRLRGGSPA